MESVSFRWREDGSKEWIFTTKEKADKGLLERADGTGMGLCLIAADAINTLSKWAAAEPGRSFWPLFKEETTDDGKETLGEDYYFWKKLTGAGVRLLIDHRLSWETGHLAERPVFPRDIQLAAIVQANRARLIKATE